MPVYEYVCKGCKRRFSALVGVVAGAVDPSCPGCGGTELKRIFSRFAIRSNNEDFKVFEPDDGPEDISQVKKMARRMKDDYGEDFDDDFDDILSSEETDDSLI